MGMVQPTTKNNDKKSTGATPALVLSPLLSARLGTTPKRACAIFTKHPPQTGQTRPTKNNAAPICTSTRFQKTK